MKCKCLKRIYALLLSLLLLLTGCTTQPAVSPSEPGSVSATVPTTEPEAPELRYQVEWAKDTVIYEVNVRQYTEEGTFAAFSEHLQTLKDMGINTLWFMPIHPISETNRSGILGSYYSITDYMSPGTVLIDIRKLLSSRTVPSDTHCCPPFEIGRW